MSSLRIFALLIVAATAHGYLVVPNSAVEEEEMTDDALEQPPAEEPKEDKPEEVYIGPTLYYYESSLNWYTSAGLCDRFERVLCSYNELCPDTDPENGGKQLVHDVLPGDHWVAIQDNDWMQIGNAHGHPCISLSSMQWPEAKTKWSRTSQSKPWKGYVFCCKEPTPSPEPEVILRFIGKTVTYDMSKHYCAYQGRRLCASSEICVDDKPVYGGSYGDHWVATSDQDNDWVQIGTENAPICRHHDPLPEWGKRRDRSGLDYLGYVYCCK